MPVQPDGSDSGWISKHAFQVGALAADTIGRQAVADGYLYEAKLRAIADNSLNAARIARYTYDFAVLGGAVSAIALTGTALPAQSLIIGGMMYVATLLEGGAGATGALSVEAANDLVAATVVAGAPWSSTGIKAIIPVFSAATAVLTTVARTPVLTVAVNPLTAGKFNLFVYYVVTD